MLLNYLGVAYLWSRHFDDRAISNGTSPSAVRCVQRVAWEAIAQGLAVTVGLGTTAAHVGDTVESLLHRVDLAMYAGKRRNRAR
jgi:hypothetical protein